MVFDTWLAPGVSGSNGVRSAGTPVIASAPKVAPWYAKRFGPANVFNKRVVTVGSKAEFGKILADYFEWRKQFLDENGELKPSYRPVALTSSFMADPAVSQREQIPVPRGPGEVW